MKKEDEMLICWKRPQGEAFKTLQDFSRQNKTPFFEVEASPTMDILIDSLQFHLPIKDNPYLEICRRGDVENNSDYIQLVVGIVIRCGNHIILLKCKKGDMAGNLTLCQGHCEYRPEYQNLALGDILKQEGKREFNEELLFSQDKYIFQKFYRGVLGYSLNCYDPKDISYYHLGIIQFIYLHREMLLDLRNTSFLCSGEKDKNDICILNLDANPTNLHPDSWVVGIMNLFKKRTIGYGGL